MSRVLWGEVDSHLLRLGDGFWFDLLNSDRREKASPGWRQRRTAEAPESAPPNSESASPRNFASKKQYRKVSSIVRNNVRV